MKEELLNTILKLMRSEVESNIRFGATLLIKNFTDEEIRIIFIDEAKLINENAKGRHDYPVFRYYTPSIKGADIFESSESGKLWIVSRTIYPIRIGSFTNTDKDKGFTNGLILRITN